MNAEQQRIAFDLAILLDEDDAVWNFVVEAIGESRDKAPRTSDDRDSGDILNDVIAALLSVGNP